MLYIQNINQSNLHVIDITIVPYQSTTGVSSILQYRGKIESEYDQFSRVSESGLNGQFILYNIVCAASHRTVSGGIPYCHQSTQQHHHGII